MANLTLRQTVTATDPGSTSAKGSALTHTEADSNFILLNTDIQTRLTDVSGDTTPQLGGDLDVNGNKIVSASNGDIDIEPNGTGDVLLGNFKFDADQTVGAGQDNYVLTYDNGTGKISLEAATGGGGGIAAVVDDTTPQLGGTLDTNDQAIGNDGSNGYIDFEKRIQIDENVADYAITVDNQNEQGLGLRIKAGDKDYVGSLAILSVSDKNNVNQFIVKANGETTAYENLTIGRAGTDSGVNGIVYIQPGSIGTLNSGDDLNVTTNGGTLSLNSIDFPSTDGSANQILKTNGSGALSFVNASDVALTSVVEDTDPTLGARLDLNGFPIQDDTRDYQLIGNVSALNTSDYDATNNLSRVRGVVKIHEVDTPTDRVHSHPVLTRVTAGADSSDATNNGPGRLRLAYIDSQYDLNGFDNTTTGFGKGFNASFSSGVARNDDAGNAASTLTQQTGLTITPQQYSASTGGLTVTDCRAINMEPNVNDSNCTVTNLYGLYYNQIGAGTVTNQYSFYGNVADASVYNAGGFQMPVVTVANLSTLPAREGNTAYVTNNTAGTGSVAKCLVFYDGSNWKLAHDPATTAA